MRFLFLSAFILLGACSQKSEVSISQKEIKQAVYAQDFKLKKPIQYNWMKENKQLQAGTLLVIQVDGQHFKPQEVKERVLYVGPWVVQKLNSGHSGHIVGFVPTVSKKELTHIWLGAPELPEQVELPKSQQTYKKGLALLKNISVHRQKKTLLFTAEKDFYRELALKVKAYAPQEYSGVSYLAQ